MLVEQDHRTKNNLTFLFEIEPDSRKKDLALRVVENIQKPLDFWAVAAILESLGLRDKDARKLYGSKSIFQLAEEIYDLCVNDKEIQKQLQQKTDQKQQIKSAVLSFVKHYPRGFSFMLPVLGQIALLLLFRYSLWAYMEFTEAQATMVAMGTILSFIVTGGFIQATGRDVLFYLNTKDYRLAQMSYFRLFRYHALLVIVFMICAFSINAIFPFYKMEMIVNMLIYFVLLSELWFALTILYLIKHYIVVLLVTVVGIAPVWAVMNYTDWGIFYAHFAGLMFANMISWMYSLKWFQRKKRRQRYKTSVRLPHRAITAFVTSPYFIYGALYFCFLFADRFISWSTVAEDVPMMLIWFRTPYELGMDWALLSLFITIALLEFTIERFSETLIPVQDRIKIFDMDKFIKFYHRFYIKQLLVLIILGIGSIAITYFGVLYLKRFDYIREVRDFFSSRITFFTFYVAATAYLFMAIGLFNSLFFLTLARLNFAVRAISISLAVNIVIGMLLSRWIGYEYAVFGLLTGSIVFAMITSNYSGEYFKKLDYYYYSAY